MKRLGLVVLLLGLGACDGGTALDEAEAAFAAKAYAQAAPAFEAALAEAGPTQRPRIEARLGQTLKLLGRNTDARTHLQAAIDTGDGATAALAQRYLGRLLADTGDFAGALTAYDAAKAWLVEHGPEEDLLKVQVHRAGLAWYQQDFETAWSAYTDVYHRAAARDDAALKASGIDGMAMLLGYAGESEAADGLYGQAIDFYTTLGKSSAVARAQAGRAVIALNAGELDDARRLAQAALETAEANGIEIVATQARLVSAMISTTAGQHADALSTVDAMLAKKGTNPFLAEEARMVALQALIGAERWADFAERSASFEPKRVENRSLLATLRAHRAHALGDAAERRAQLEAAVKHFETVRSQLGAEQLGSVFNALRLEAYEGLIDVLARAGEAEAALRLIGSIKARAFGEALRAEEQREVSVGLPDARTIQRARLRFKLAELKPSVAPATVRAALSDDVAVIEYYALRDRLLVFWVTRSGVTVQSAPVTRATVRTQGDALLAGIRNAGVGYIEPAAKLGTWLLDPIATQLNDAAGVKALVIVPHGPLHPVPFEALPWAGGLLVDRFAIVSAANLTALHAAVLAPPRQRSKVLAVGDAEKNLPGARREAEEVAKRFDGQVLLGSAAHESAVRKAMREKDLLHFAVHGIRPTPSAPAYLALAADSGSDGKLHADELATERLKAALVVLSVCDSARGRPNRGDEIVGVIDRAFLRAGARSVVASRWPVHDAASVLFMRRFYDGLRAGRPMIEAFHGAQLALRRKDAHPEQLGALLASLDGSRVRGFQPARVKAPPKDFAHPYYWAAFSLRGAWQ